MASTSTTSPPPASPKAPSSASVAAPAGSPKSSSPKSSSETPRPILETTWHALSQGPPPALREILSAYNAKGEGDRDMLIALLNAKSAEDQRLAALATLHQTVLQMQHTIAIAAVTAQSPPGRAPPAQAPLPAPPQGSPRSQSQLQPPQPQPRRKRSHPDYAPDTYRHHAYDEREPTLPPSPESSSSSPPRSEFPHLSNPGTMSIRTLLHPSKRRRESGYDERAYDDRYDERVYEEREREREHRDRDREREYRARDAPRRPHVVVHPPSVERDSHRYAVRTSSARDEAAEVSGRSP